MCVRAAPRHVEPERNEAMSTLPRLLALDAPPADIVDASADLIARDGLHVNGYWPQAPMQRYRRGMPVDAVGAIAVTLGHTAHIAVEWEVIPPVLGDLAGDRHCAPAVIALMGHLRSTLNGLFTWSDTTGKDGVVAAMRACAAKIRTVPTCMCCGVELGRTCQSWCEFVAADQALRGTGVPA
jgi:hypothetical protein